MSEGVRKHLRTQGKYSDKGLHSGDKGHKSRDKRQKVSPAAKEPPEKKFHKRNSDGNKGASTSLADESVSPLKYEENSDYSFTQLEDAKKPIEIKNCGKHVLSDTDNGESTVFYEPDFLYEAVAYDYFDRLHCTTNWHTKNIVIQGVEYPQPRLVAWYGPFPYSYSGATLEPAEMPEAVIEIKERVEQYLTEKGIEATFNSVLLNLYRNGKDSVSWHSDDELTMGISPTIASVSLGETRKFEMRRKMKHYEDESPADQMDKYFVRLTHGSLLIMTGCMQDDWQHRVPKEYHDKEARINLTFRTVFPLEKIIFQRFGKRFRKRFVGNNSWNETPRSRRSNFNNSKLESSNNLWSPCSGANKSYDNIRSRSLPKETDEQNVPLSKEQYSCDLHMSNARKSISGHKRFFSGDTKTNCMDSVTSKESVIPSKYDNFGLERLLNCNVDLMERHLLAEYAFVLKKRILKNIPELRNSEREELEFLCELTAGSHTAKNQRLITKRMQSIFSRAIEKHQIPDFEKSSVAVQVPEKVQFSNAPRATAKELPEPSECDDEQKRNCIILNENINTYVNSTSTGDDNFAANDDVNRAHSIDSRVKSEQAVVTRNNNELPCSGTSNKSCDSIQASNLPKETDVQNVPLIKEQYLCDLHMSNAQKSISGHERFFSGDKKTNCMDSITSKESVIPSKYDNFGLESLLNCNVDLMERYLLMEYAFVLRKRILKNIPELRNPEREELEFLCELIDGSHTAKNQRLITKRMQSIFSRAIEKHQIPDFEKSSVAIQVPEKVQFSNKFAAAAKEPSEFDNEQRGNCIILNESVNTCSNSASTRDDNFGASDEDLNGVRPIDSLVKQAVVTTNDNELPN